MFMCDFKIAIFKKGRRVWLHESWLIRGLSDVQYCTIFCCTLPDWHCAQWGSRCGHGRVKTSSCCIVSEGEKYQIIFVLQGQLSIYVAVLTKSGPFSAKSIGRGLILQQEIEKQCSREKHVWIHFRKNEKGEEELEAFVLWDKVCCVSTPPPPLDLHHSSASFDAGCSEEHERNIEHWMLFIPKKPPSKK